MNNKRTVFIRIVALVCAGLILGSVFMSAIFLR